MSRRWSPDVIPEPVPFGPLGWARLAARGSVLSTLLAGGLGLLLAIRLLERPLWGQHRPLSPYVTQAVSRAALAILGIRYRRRGAPMRNKGAAVANHCSWIDIFALNAGSRVYFVSKSEVAGWPVIGWLARATGTLFIRRQSRDARIQKSVIEARLNLGHELLFFPEGTSSDGSLVLPFKSTLFEAFFSDGLRDSTWVQPVTLVYRPPPGAPAWFYGWWGEMEFVPHLAQVLAAPGSGLVEVTYHAPLRVGEFRDRKALAKACEKAVREAHSASVAAPLSD